MSTIICIFGEFFQTPLILIQAKALIIMYQTACMIYTSRNMIATLIINGPERGEEQATIILHLLIFIQILFMYRVRLPTL